MKLPFGLQIVSRAASGTVDTTRPGWRQRMGDMIHAARGKAGLASGTDRATPPQLAEYYGLLPKLTFPQIRGLMMDWMAGNWAAGYDLVSVMLDTWPVALKNQHECRSTVRRITYRATPWKIGDTDATARAVEKADFVNACLEGFQATPGTDERGLGGTVYGLAGALIIPTIRESLWRRDGVEWRPFATAWAHPRTYGTVEEKLDDGRQITRLAARVGDNSGLPMLGYRTGADGRWLPLRDSLIGIYDTRDGAASVQGLFRPLSWWWGGMMYGREFLMRYAEMFGQPLRIGYYANGIKPDDLAVLKSMLGNMGASAWAALPEEVRKLEFYESKGTGADNPQRFMIEHADKYCDLLFKGETSQGGNYSGGQREQADFRQASRTARDEAYADWIAELLREQLAREIILRNYGTVDELPFIIPDYTTEPDRKEQATVVNTWLQSYDMDPADAAEISGLPLVAKVAPAVPVVGRDEPPARPLPGATLRATDAGPARPVAASLLASALAADLAPVRARLETILALEDDAALKAELAALQAELPSWMHKDSAAAVAFEKILGTALLEGLTEKPTEKP